MDTKKRPRGVTDRNKDEIVRRFMDGESATSIGSSFGITGPPVRKKLNMWGYSAKDMRHLAIDLYLNVPDPVAIYVAGLFDGEGTIISARLLNGRIDFSVGVSNTHRPVTEYLRRWFGGSLSGHKPNNEAHRTIWMWGLGGTKAGAFLARIEPYLIVKREQANAAIIHAETLTWNFNGKSLTPEAVRIREMAHRSLKTLKHVEYKRSES